MLLQFIKIMKLIQNLLLVTLLTNQICCYGSAAIRGLGTRCTPLKTLSSYTQTRLPLAAYRIYTTPSPTPLSFATSPPQLPLTAFTPHAASHPLMKRPQHRYYTLHSHRSMLSTQLSRFDKSFPFGYRSHMPFAAATPLSRFAPALAAQDSQAEPTQSQSKRDQLEEEFLALKIKRMRAWNSLGKGIADIGIGIASSVVGVACIVAAFAIIGGIGFLVWEGLKECYAYASYKVDLTKRRWGIIPHPQEVIDVTMDMWPASLGEYYNPTEADNNLEEILKNHGTAIIQGESYFGGKTALATEYARKFVKEHPDALVIYFNLYYPTRDQTDKMLALLKECYPGYAKLGSSSQKYLLKNINLLIRVINTFPNSLVIIDDMYEHSSYTDEHQCLMVFLEASMRRSTKFNITGTRKVIVTSNSPKFSSQLATAPIIETPKEINFEVNSGNAKGILDGIYSHFTLRCSPYSARYPHFKEGLTKILDMTEVKEIDGKDMHIVSKYMINHHNEDYSLPIQIMAEYGIIQAVEVDYGGSYFIISSSLIEQMRREIEQ